MGPRGNSQSMEELSEAVVQDLQQALAKEDDQDLKLRWFLACEKRLAEVEARNCQSLADLAAEADGSQTKVKDLQEQSTAARAAMADLVTDKVSGSWGNVSCLTTQDLLWALKTLREHSEEEKTKFLKKISSLERKVETLRAYKKRSMIEEEAFKKLREEAQGLQKQHAQDVELLKEMDQALHYRLEEVDQLNVKVKMMSRHIEVIQGGMLASKLLETSLCEVVEEPRCSRRCSMPACPAQDYDRDEELAADGAYIRDLIENPLVLPPPDSGNEVSDENMESAMQERAVTLHHLVKELREGLNDAVRLRMHGIAGNVC